MDASNVHFAIMFNESPADKPPFFHVFVYGTLRAGEINDIIEAAKRHGLPVPILLGQARIAGTLFDFGPYPGLLIDAEAHAGPQGAARTVLGDVYRITTALLPVLDEIEGIGATSREAFYRAHCQVFLTGSTELGETGIACEYYPVDPDTVRGLPRIILGDWIHYRQTRDAA